VTEIATPTPTPRPLPAPSLPDQVRLLRTLFRDPVPMLDEVARRFDSMCRIGAGPVRMAIVGDPVAVRELFSLPNDHFRWGHKFNVLGFVTGASSMIVSDGEDHRRRRGSVQAAFSRRRLNRWIPMILERTDAVIDGLLPTLGPDGRTVDLYPVGRSLVLEIAVRALFGDRMAARVDEIGARFEGPQQYLEGSFASQLPHRIPHTRRARVRADREALVAIVDEQIAARRAHPTGDPYDVLVALVVEPDLTVEEIRDQVITLIGAGFDTTAATLAWMLWCVTAEPGLWARLRAEADVVIGTDVAGADETTLAGLDLARRAMRETTRLHPAGVVSPREAAVDLVVGGYEIPAGTLVLWSAHLAGRAPSAWCDPDRFDVERWCDADDEQRALMDRSWVPFGGGARNCIGFALAQMELTLVVARLAQRLDVGPTAPVIPRPVGMVVNRPEGGAPMVVAERH
jgi:cytochrome P450